MEECTPTQRLLEAQAADERLLQERERALRASLRRMYRCESCCRTCCSFWFPTWLTLSAVEKHFGPWTPGTPRAVGIGAIACSLSLAAWLTLLLRWRRRRRMSRARTMHPTIVSALLSPAGTGDAEFSGAKAAERDRLQEKLGSIFRRERGFGNVCVAVGLVLPLPLAAMHSSRNAFAMGELLILALGCGSLGGVILWGKRRWVLLKGRLQKVPLVDPSTDPWAESKS